jgi:hypothetical protein
MVLPRFLYNQFNDGLINDEHLFSLFKLRENCDSLYEQCGLDREILKALNPKYPYCVILLINNYVIHNPMVCWSRKKLLGGGEEIIPRNWSSYLGGPRCYNPRCNYIADVYCQCISIRPGDLPEQPKILINCYPDLKSVEIGMKIKFKGMVVAPDPIYIMVKVVETGWYDPTGRQILPQKRLRRTRPPVRYIMK